jgi:hypothetical protein
LNNEILANLLLAKHEGKNFQCKGYKTLLLDKKKYQSHYIFRGKKFGIVATEKKIQCKKGFLKKRFIFGKIAPNSPHFEERNSEAAIFRQ